MKFAASLALVVGAANAHTIFQKISVNGADQGQLVGVRAPSSDNPVQDVTSAALACNQGYVQPVSSQVINVPSGAQIGTWWGHVIGGPQTPGDTDNPIAPSHHGPMIYYLAKVNNAASTGTSGLSWFKIGQDGLDSSGKWGIDRMYASGGWAYVTLPQCLAPGNYLLRAEALALHSAYNQGGAQFYPGCVQINVQGSGSWTGSNLLAFPGAYSATDPGILINIYGSSGNPDNGGKAYTPPGGAVQTCPAGGSSPTSSSSRTSTATSTSAATSTSSSSSSGAALYGQCGGQGWTGATTCASGTCTVSNQYYSQCLP